VQTEACIELSEKVFPDTTHGEHGPAS
jgi:hypothetical protein